MSQHQQRELLTPLKYVRLGTNSQSLICSLFSKVILLKSERIVDLSENCKHLLDEQLKGIDESLFWNNLLEEFGKLINIQEDVNLPLENSGGFELFPSLTSNDEEEEDSSDLKVSLVEIGGEKINIQRRWNNTVHENNDGCETLNQIIDRIELVQGDMDGQIEIMEGLLKSVLEKSTELKNIYHVCGVKYIENQLVFHRVLEECLKIYYCQSDSNQLDSLSKITKLFNFFTRIFKIKHVDLCTLKHILLFNVEQFLPIVTIFCFSYHYKLRDAVYEFMKTLSQFPCLKGGDLTLLKENEIKWFENIPEKKIIQDSLTLYVDLTDCNSWMKELGENTFKTRFLSMTHGEATSIVKEYERWFFGTQSTLEEQAILCELAHKINQVMDEFPNREAFVKLSHRSPKDAAFKVNQYDAMVEDMVKEWSQLYGLETDSSGDRLALQHEKYQSAISQICAQKCMKVKSGEEFIKLMTISYRSHVDLSISLGSDAMQYQNNDTIPIQIVVREWIDIPIWREVRTFIRNKKMTAMSQYFSSSFFPNVPIEEYQTMKRVILEYFEKVKDIIPLDDCCIDFVVLDLEKGIVKIIELNSFGDNCGPAYFSWELDSDRLLIYNGPLEFRIATNSNTEKEYQLVL